MADPLRAERRYGKKLQGWLERAVRTAVIGVPATDRGRLSGEGCLRNHWKRLAPASKTCLDGMGATGTHIGAGKIGARGTGGADGIRDRQETPGLALIECRASCCMT